MALLRGTSDETLARLLVLGGLAYVLLNTWRNSLATDFSGLAFEPAAPTGAGAALDPILSILSPMQVSSAGQAFIKQHEGWTGAVRSDGANHKVIGWGHDLLPGESFPNGIQQYPQGENLFQGDLATAAAAVNQAVKVALTQNQFDALADLAFNEGAAAFAGSTLVRLLNGGDYAGAAAQFSQWNKSGGSVNSGLVARRGADANLFNT